MHSLEHTDAQHLSPLKILLAEDNLTNQKLTLRQLQLLGYCADTVINGQAAVDAVQTTDYDVILMDCQMPEIDGFQATVMIRAWEQQQLPQRHSIVIIAMTASDLEQDRGRAKSIGMNDYLTKPVRKEVLAALLNHWQQVILNSSDSTATKEARPLPHQSIASEPLPVAHLNLTYLKRLSDDAPEFAVELLISFLEDSNNHLKMLREAISHQDSPQIRQIAHHIKGASANVGAMKMCSLAEQLEYQLDLTQAATTAELVDQLERSLTQIQGFLHRMRNETRKICTGE